MKNEIMGDDQPSTESIGVTEMQKLNDEKAECDAFDQSSPNNVRVLKANNLKSFWKVAHCEKCDKMRLIQFATETPQEFAHWECNECGEIFEEEDN